MQRGWYLYCWRLPVWFRWWGQRATWSLAWRRRRASRSRSSTSASSRTRRWRCNSCSALSPTSRRRCTATCASDRLAAPPPPACLIARRRHRWPRRWSPCGATAARASDGQVAPPPPAHLIARWRHRDLRWWSSGGATKTCTSERRCVSLQTVSRNSHISIAVVSVSTVPCMHWSHLTPDQGLTRYWAIFTFVSFCNYQ